MGNSCFSKKPPQVITSKLSITSSRSAIPEESLPQPFNTGKAIKWKLGEQIAEGRFCKIFQCINLKTGELLIMKSYPSYRSSTGFFYELKKIRKEAEILKHLNHKSIIQMFQLESSCESIDLIMECIPGGCLSELLQKYGAMEEEIIKCYLRQIIQALDYLHDQGISHNNIKAENIFITSEGKLKISGFKNYTKFGPCRPDQDPMLQAVLDMHTSLAPEIFIDKKVYEESDSWSVGCLAIHLLTGQEPFSYISPYKEEVIKYLCSDDPTLILPKASDAMECFVESCLIRDPEKRPGIKDLYNFHIISGKKYSCDINLNESMKMSLNQTADCHNAIAEMDNE